jgi:hypothetical protein
MELDDIRRALHPLGLAATRTRGAKAREVVSTCTALGVGVKPPKADGAAGELAVGEAVRLSLHALTVAATGCSHHPATLSAAIGALLKLLSAHLLRGEAYVEALQVGIAPLLPTHCTLCSRCTCCAERWASPH